MYVASTSQEVVLTGYSNLQPTAADCCRSCFQNSPCRVWVFCDRADGCTPPPAAEAYAPQQPLPYQGCQLLNVPNFHTLFNDTNDFRFTAGDVQFMAGAPILLMLPPTAGYTVHPGTDLNNYFDFNCSYSTADSRCVVVGSASDVAHMCDADVRCQGFTYIPEQSALTPRPLGVLKGNFGGLTMSATDLAINPSTAVYLKDSTGNAAAATSTEGASSEHGHSHVLWVVLPSALGLSFMLGGMAMCAVAARTYHQGKKDMVEAATMQAALLKTNGSLGRPNSTSTTPPGSGSTGARSSNPHTDGATASEGADATRQPSNTTTATM